MAKKLTQEDFVERVEIATSGKVDVSNFVYVNNYTKGICKCNVCGNKWEAMPMSLLKGHACPRCAVEYKARKISLTKEAFIENARKVHGDKYDYSKVEYLNNKTKVCIICPEHGVFWQKPNVHLQGNGCQKCCKTGVKLTQEEFLERVKEKNKHEIDYSKFVYVNAITKSTCRCLVCGNEWNANSQSLFSGFGCPKCGIKSRTDKRRETTEGFIEKYKEKFPTSDYDFTDSIYVNALTKMDVLCKKHGKFSIKPNDLLFGHGCPMCHTSSLELLVSSVLFKNNVYFESQKKFPWLLRQSLDFYIPSINIAIECQGEQHFVPVEYFGGQEKLDKSKFRDELKRALCKNNNVELIYFLPKEYNSFLDCENKHFNDVVELMEYIGSKKNEQPN